MAADPVRALIDGHVMALAQEPGRGKSRNAGPNDCNLEADIGDALDWLIHWVLSGAIFEPRKCQSPTDSVENDQLMLLGSLRTAYRIAGDPKSAASFSWLCSWPSKVITPPIARLVLPLAGARAIGSDRARRNAPQMPSDNEANTRSNATGDA